MVELVGSAAESYGPGQRGQPALLKMSVNGPHTVILSVNGPHTVILSVAKNLLFRR